MITTIQELESFYKNLNTETLPEKNKKAIEKLETYKTEDEIENDKKNNKEEKESQMQKLIKAQLIYAITENDEQLIKSINESKYKSIRKCVKYIENWAKKQAVNNCAMIDSESVLSQSIHYYTDEEDKAPEKPKPIETEYKPTYKVPEMPKPKEPENEQLGLF